MSELSRLLQAANDRNPMTLRQRAERIGNALNFAHLAKLQAGDHGQPTEKTLHLLSVAYDIPYREIQRAAGVKVGAGPYEPPAEAARLSRREQDALTDLIKAIVTAKEAPAGVPGQSIEFGDLSPDLIDDGSSEVQDRHSKAQTGGHPPKPSKQPPDVPGGKSRGNSARRRPRTR